MIRPQEIFANIQGVETFDISMKDSYYLVDEDVTLRVSNHLPKFKNLLSYENGDPKKIFFIFTSEVSELETEKMAEELEGLDVECDYTFIENIEEIEIAMLLYKRFCA